MTHTLSTTRAAISPSIFGEMSIDLVVFVPLWAMRLGKLSRPRNLSANSTPHVFKVSYWFKVIRVCANAIPAQVVKFKAVRERAVQLFPQPAMRHLEASQRGARVNSGISRIAGSTPPSPAPIGNNYLHPELLPIGRTIHPVALGKIGVTVSFDSRPMFRAHRSANGQFSAITNNALAHRPYLTMTGESCRGELWSF